MSETRQIQSMIDFIEREAQEKAEELHSAAQEEYDVEKMRLVESEKAKIRTNTEKRKKQVDIDRRVARANYSKTQRLRVMEERAKVMEKLHERTRQKVLDTVANTGVYYALLVKLIRQCLMTIRTDTVLHCRKEDVTHVQQILGDLVAWYKEKGGSDIQIKLGNTYLDPREEWGGVMAQSADGRIVCDNTLAYRAKICFEEQLPTVRFYLFTPEVAV